MTKLTQNSWLGGQMDVRMTGRQDMRNYRNGASVLKNFVPVKLGSIRKRPGTDFVTDITGWVGANHFRMIPFGYLSEDGFVLVLCPGANPRAKAFRSDGTEITVSGTIPYGIDNYGNEEIDQIGYVQCNDILFLAHRNHPPAKIEHTRSGSSHVFSYSPVDFNPVTTTPTVGTPTMTRQYFEDFTFNAEDQAYLDQCKTRGDFYEDDKWVERWEARFYNENRRKYSGKTVVRYRASVVLDGAEGPLSAEPDVPDPLPNTGETKGSGYDAFTSPWTESQVIRIPVDVTIPKCKSWEIRLYKENGGVYGLIGTHKGDWESTWVGANHAISKTFTDDNIAPDTSETPIDTSDGVPFSGVDEYPASVGLYQQRLVWASTNNDPARIWMSRAGDLYEYRPHVRLQTDDAIDFILPITQFANVNFIVELGRLFAFAECTELLIGSASDSAGISYETIMATEHSHLGCTKRLPPIVANNTLLFVNRTGQSVRDYDERLGSSRFGGTDVSVFSSSIFEDNPIVDWTWQQEPNSTVWCVLKDGRLASFTYDKEQEIAAWAVHELGGDGKALGIAKTCAVFGREAGRPTSGEIIVAVERNVGGWHGITLERMRPWAKGAAGSGLSYCVDMMKFVNAGENIAGLPWWTLKYMNSDEIKTAAEANGDGWITHTPGVSVVANRPFYVFFEFESVMTTMPPVIGDQGGASQFDVKLGQHAHLRTVGSQGGEIYAAGMGMQKARIDDGAVRDGEDGAAFRDVDVVLAGSNNRDGRVTVRHDEPWPFQLALLELDYEVES